MKPKLKSESQIKIMHEGGRKLKAVKDRLVLEIKAGVSAKYIDNLACDLILKADAEPSFKMVEGYLWTTCININKGLVHGIPHANIVFKDQDVVSVDLGLYYKGFHTDTSTTVVVGKANTENKIFLAVGKKALAKAIKQAVDGNKIYDISSSIESTLNSAKLTPIKAFVGHGIGTQLHEDPQVPCFTYGPRDLSLTIRNGLVIAIEIMYTKGSPDVVLENDGWTISMRDGKISALFEDTVAVTENGPLVLTD